MKNIKEFYRIKQSFAMDRHTWIILRAKLVEQRGQISVTDLKDVFDPTKEQDIKPEIWALVYAALYEMHSQELAKYPPQHFFTDLELKRASTLSKRNAFEEWPVLFRAVIPLAPQDQYCVCLSALEIKDLNDHNLLITNPDMQRESTIYKYKDVELVCVSYSKAKVDAIYDNLICGKQFATALKFHYIPSANDDWNYDSERLTLELNGSGTLLLIDGRHRVDAISLAVSHNPSIGEAYRIPVIITIGSARMAKDIIVQDEERTPIDVNHLARLKGSPADSIIQIIKTNEDIAACFRFSQTVDQFKNGFGFIVESELDRGIREFFHIKTRVPKNKGESIAAFLIDFLCECYALVEEKEEGYWSKYTSHWKRSRVYYLSNEYTIYSLVYLASVLWEQDDWADKLENIFSRISLKYMLRKYTEDRRQDTLRYIKKILEEEGLL